jgi:hypothetical protein
LLRLLPDLKKTLLETKPGEVHRVGE